MVVAQLANESLLLGLVYAILGVGFWVGGLLVFNWLWQYFRNDSDS